MRPPSAGDEIGVRLDRARDTRDAEDHPPLDSIRIPDLLPISLPDLLPLAAIAIVIPSDEMQVITRHDLMEDILGLLHPR
jgi:hypothetical protein